MLIFSIRIIHSRIRLKISVNAGIKNWYDLEYSTNYQCQY